MGDDPDLPRRPVRDEDAGRAERLDDLRRRAHLPDVDVEHVRLDRRRVDREPVDRGEPGRELMGGVVILDRPVDELLERDDPAGRDDPGLAHPTADEAAPVARLVDERPGPDEERPERTGETLRQVDHRAVDAGDELLGVEALGGRGVQHPRAVEVDGEAVLPGDGLDLALVDERHDRAAAAVVGVLDPDEPAPRVVDVRPPDRCPERLRPNVAPVRVDDRRRHPRDGGEPAGLVVEDVRVAVEEHLVARPAVDEERDEVRHRARQEEQRRLRPEALGDHRLEARDRRVLAVRVVAELRGRHRRAHPGRRQRLGVAPEVDDGRRCLHALCSPSLLSSRAATVRRARTSR